MKTIQKGRTTAQNKSWSRLAIAAAAVATLSLGACGGDDEGGDGGGGGGGDIDVPDSPLATVEMAGEAMANKNFATVFGMLPESYQKDLNGVVSEFGNAMDSDLWNSIIGIGKDLGHILTEKADVVKGSQMFKNIDTDGAMSENFDQIAKAINDLFTSDAITLDSLKSGNMMDLLSGPASGLAKNMGAIPGADFSDLEKLSNAKLEVVSEEGDSATIKITDPDGESHEEKFTKVEGRWIPAKMAEGWGQMIAEAKSGIAEMSTDLASGKDEAMAQLSGIGEVISGLKDAKSSTDFDMAIGMMMMKIMGGGAGGAQPPSGF